MSKAQKMLLDGYNVIHADAALKRHAEKDMNRARLELIDRLKIYLKDKEVRMTLVFDGQGGITDVEMILPAKLQVMYSPFGQTADELILSSLRASANPREYIVVTSDAMDIGREARSLGAEVLSSGEFLKRIAKNAAESLNGRAEKPLPNEDDMDFWLRVFNAGEEKTNDGGRK